MSDAPFRIIGTPRFGGILVVSDHASNRVPEGIDLGIAPNLLEQHIAIDIGVAAVDWFAISIGTNMPLPSFPSPVTATPFRATTSTTPRARPGWTATSAPTTLRWPISSMTARRHLSCHCIALHRILQVIPRNGARGLSAFSTTATIARRGSR